MIYVGIDVASEKHDFMIMTDNQEFYSKSSVTIQNTEQGFEKLHNVIQTFCGAKSDFQVRIGLESTGFYHCNIVSFLLNKGYQLTLINPILTNTFKKSIKVHASKTDNIDSKVLCLYLYQNKDDFKPYTIKSYHIEALKSLTRGRFNLSEDLRKTKLGIYKILTELFPEYLKLFTNVYEGTAIDIITKYPSPKKLSKAHLSTLDGMIHKKCKVTASKLIETAKSSVGIDNEYLSFSLIQTINRLNFIKSQIKEYDEMIEKYVTLLDTKILSIPGIGPVTAGLILGEIGDISNFSSPDKLTSYAGIDIEVYESGKFKATNHRMSKKGSKYLRYALYQSARVCLKFDPTFKAYYEKKKSENKHYYVILGHIEKKLLRVIYSILKSGEEYAPR